MNLKARIYPAIACLVALAALVFVINFIEQHRTAPSLLTDVDMGNFEQVVLDSKTPVFIEFYQHGCRQCDQELPTLNKLVMQYRGRVTFVRIDMAASSQIAAALHASVAPTHVFFNPPTESGFARTGYLDEPSLIALIEHGLHPLPAPAKAAPPTNPPAPSKPPAAVPPHP